MPIKLIYHYSNIKMTYFFDIKEHIFRKYSCGIKFDEVNQYDISVIRCLKLRKNKQVSVALNTSCAICLVHVSESYGMPYWQVLDNTNTVHLCQECFQVCCHIQKKEYKTIIVGNEQVNIVLGDYRLVLFDSESITTFARTQQLLKIPVLRRLRAHPWKKLYIATKSRLVHNLLLLRELTINDIATHVFALLFDTYYFGYYVSKNEREMNKELYLKI